MNKDSGKSFTIHVNAHVLFLHEPHDNREGVFMDVRFIGCKVS